MPYVITDEMHRKLVENERLQNEGIAQEVDATAVKVEYISIWESSRDGEYDGWVAKPVGEGQRSDMLQVVRD